MKILIINSPSCLIFFFLGIYTLLIFYSVTVHSYPWLSNKDQKLHERAIKVVHGAWQDVVTVKCCMEEWSMYICKSCHNITPHTQHWRLTEGRFSTTLHFQTLDGCGEKDSGLHTFLRWFIFIFTHAARHHRSLQRLVSVWERCLHCFRYVWNDANISGMICKVLKMTQGYTILEKKTDIAIYIAIWKKTNTGIFSRWLE